LRGADPPPVLEYARTYTPTEESAVAELVTYSLEDSVATIRLDDGKVNSLSPDMLAALNRALDRAEADRAIVVLTGREARFSAGFDLSVLRAGGASAHGMLMGGFRLFERLLSFPRPTIAACTGHAIAAGSFLLLSCDVRLGALGAFKIGANEVAIGLTMPYTATEIMRNRLSPRFFGRAALTAEIFAPEDAVLAGFLDQTLPPAEVLTDALTLAARFEQLDLKAHAATKQRVRADLFDAIRKAIELDDADLRVLFQA
jgi:enoyl-CoA hydratase